MEFRRARTNLQIEERRKEIIQAVSNILENGDIDDVNFKAISEMTSIARPTIYKYYKTKEEILLDILSDDIKVWTNIVEDFTNNNQTLSKEAFSEALALAFDRSPRMLKFLSLLSTVFEQNCSLEKLVEFKKEMMQEMSSLYRSMSKYFPEASHQELEMTLVTIMSFISGLYPMTHNSEKQIEAMRLADYKPISTDFYTICYNGIYLLLGNL